MKVSTVRQDLTSDGSEFQVCGAVTEKTCSCIQLRVLNFVCDHPVVLESLQQLHGRNMAERAACLLTTRVLADMFSDSCLDLLWHLLCRYTLSLI